MPKRSSLLTFRFKYVCIVNTIDTLPTIIWRLLHSTWRPPIYIVEMHYDYSFYIVEMHYDYSQTYIVEMHYDYSQTYSFSTAVLFHLPVVCTYISTCHLRLFCLTFI
jgi:hypothetical protein